MSMLEHVEPRIAGGEPTIIGEGQREYRQLPGVRARNIDYAIAVDKDFNSVIMALTLTGEERQRVINGEDIYISMLTFGRDVTPIMVSVGPEEMAEAHGLEVKQSNRDYTPLSSGEIREVTNHAIVKRFIAPTIEQQQKENVQHVETFGDLIRIVKGVRAQVDSWTLPFDTALWVARATKDGSTYQSIKDELRKHALNYEPSWREVAAIHEAVCNIYRRNTADDATGCSTSEGPEAL